MAKDSFGSEVGIGDLVVSAASSTGNMKIGRVCKIHASGGFSIEHLITSGWYWSARKWNSTTKEYEDNPKPLISQGGSNTVLLRRADGSYPEGMGELLGESA